MNKLSKFNERNFRAFLILAPIALGGITVAGLMGHIPLFKGIGLAFLGYALLSVTLIGWELT